MLETSLQRRHPRGVLSVGPCPLDRHTFANVTAKPTNPFPAFDDPMREYFRIWYKVRK